jgi:hypothetical protein
MLTLNILKPGLNLPTDNTVAKMITALILSHSLPFLFIKFLKSSYSPPKFPINDINHRLFHLAWSRKRKNFRKLSSESRKPSPNGQGTIFGAQAI